jgi:hypothetical protein
MSAFLLKFEAIESRIASYSCPRGTSGRVHALRLRRCFQHNGRRHSAALGGQSYFHDQELQNDEQTASNYDNRSMETGAQDARVSETGYGSAGSEIPPSVILRRRLRLMERHLSYRSIWLRKHVPALQSYGDVLPFAVEDNSPESTNPDTTALYSALRTGNPHTVLETILSQIKYIGYNDFSSSVLRTIPATTFSEVLRCMDPKHFVDRYAKLQTEISPAYAKVLSLPSINRAGYHTFCRRFLSQIRIIMEARRKVSPLGLQDYKFLLKCARAVGDPKGADAIWEEIMRRDGKIVVPDAECYNHYLAAKCWVDVANPKLKQRLRVVPNNLEPRAWDFPPHTLKGHQVGPKGLKAQVSGHFKRMVEAGVAGNEETFCLMITALAREGDLLGVESILMRVWNVDVEALLTMDEVELGPTRSLPRDSPFYPSAQLLHALAHAYGINNAIPTALRVVDYVSRQYSVPIPLKAWNELLEWTYVLSIQRSGARLEDGANTGQLPPEAVANLWDTMVSEPYNVKPTMEMYDRLITNLTKRQRFREAQNRMQEARRLHKFSVLSLSRQQLVFHSTNPRQSQTTRSAVTEKRARDLAFTHLRVKRNRQYIRRWVRNLIHRGSTRLKYHEEWSTHQLPEVVQEWSLFLPSPVRYQVNSGEVRFWSESRIRNKRRQLRLTESKGLPRRRRMRRWIGRTFQEKRAVVNGRTGAEESRNRTE